MILSFEKLVRPSNCGGVEMNTPTLSKKSREELNGSLLNLYRKLTFKPDSLPDKEEIKSSGPAYSESEEDQADQDEQQITPAIGIGI
jgi:hypothetical protein